MTERTKETPLRGGLISLGCAKNLADAEIMLGTLLKDGIEITNDATQADVVIVNTCSFIDSAQEESVDAILQSAELREAKNRGQGLIVSGCLPQRFREDLPKLLPEVDAFMGIDQVTQVTQLVQLAVTRRREKLARVTSVEGRMAGREDRIAKSVSEKSKKRKIVWEKTASSPRPSPPEEERERISKTHSETDEPSRTTALLSTPLVEVNSRPTYIPDYETPRFRLTPRHFAYLKIAEGCNHPCSFCIIPRMRGAHRSRPQSDIVTEAKDLLADGVKELNLISQDSTYYGLDLRPSHTRAISSPDKFSAAVQSLPAEAATICTLSRQLN